jgi:hypothetical protein
MAVKKKGPRTLTNDQIRVTAGVQSAAEILRSSKPYLDAALKSMQMGDRMWQAGDPALKPIPVPPHIMRDLVTMLAAQAKLNHFFAGRGQEGEPSARMIKTDRHDWDWNPFKGIDFEVDAWF